MKSDCSVKPPSLHWAVVLLLNVVTLGFFSFVWMIVQSNWVRKARGCSDAFYWSIMIPCLFPAFAVLTVALVGVEMFTGMNIKPLQVLLIDAVKVLALISPSMASILLSGELREQPIGLKAGRWKAMIFGVTYLQFCLNRYRPVTADQLARQRSEPSRRSDENFAPSE